MREIRGIEKTDNEVPEDLDQLTPRDLREKEAGLGVLLPSVGGQTKMPFKREDKPRNCPLM